MDEALTPLQQVLAMKTENERLHALIRGALALLKESGCAEDWPAESLLQLAATKADDFLTSLDRLSAELEAAHG